MRWFSKIATLRQNLLWLLLPPHCYGCNQTWSYLCKHCTHKLYVHPEICPICHATSRGFFVCQTCKPTADPLTGIIIWFGYVGIIKRLMLKFKYKHNFTIADIIAQKLALHIRTHPHLQHQKILLTHIPSHRSTITQKRGYTPSRLIAQRLSTLIDAPYLPLLRKPQKTISQTKLHKQERKHNPSNKRTPTKHAKKSLLSQYNTILLIDDLTTTWSTIRHAARALYQQSPDHQYRWVVVARNRELDDKMRKRLYMDGRS